MLDICLLGTGGMQPLPYRWLTSMMARCDGSNLLIDCGEGTQIALKEKGWSPKPVDVICFTHYHADHISGLPGFLLTMGNAERTEPVLLVGPKVWNVSLVPCAPLRRNFRSRLCLKNSRSREKNFRRVPMWWTHSA